MPALPSADSVLIESHRNCAGREHLKYMYTLPQSPPRTNKDLGEISGLLWGLPPWPRFEEGNPRSLVAHSPEVVSKLQISALIYVFKQ